MPDQPETEFERLEGLNEAWKEFSGPYRPSMSADGKDKKLEAMQNSLSWRITAPLRRLRHRLAKGRA